jgi:hypothetical protein
MSSNNFPHTRRLHRRHKLQRDIVDSLPWPHPRPAADPRIVGLNTAFIWTSIVQIVFGPPPTSVQNVAFGYEATILFSVLMILCSAMTVYAAYCKSQYVSFGVEMTAAVGFTGVFAIYAWGAVGGLHGWWATNVAPLAFCLFVGNLVRGVKLIRRLW